MRLAHISDSHFNEHSRFKECCELHDIAVPLMKAEQVDLIIHTGDIYDRKSTPAERLAVCKWLVMAAEVAPVVICRGNHDAWDDLLILDGLKTRHPVHVFQRPMGHTPGSVFMIQPFMLAVLPWHDAAQLKASLPADADTRQVMETHQAVTERLVACFTASLQQAMEKFPDLCPVFMGHVDILGAEVSSGQVMQGSTVSISHTDLQRLPVAYAALGHIHKHQGWDRVAYAGSPRRCNYGEPEAKGFMVVDCHRGMTEDTIPWVSSRRFVELPCPEMHRHELDISGMPSVDWHAALADVASRCADNSSTRLRVLMRPDQVDILPHPTNLENFFGHCADFKLEPVVKPQERVRAEGIQEQQDLWGKVQTWMEVTGQTPPDCPDQVREKELQVKLGLLEDALEGEGAQP